jgi:crotonobetaine/carnitine-CoA ligase
VTGTAHVPQTVAQQMDARAAERPDHPFLRFGGIDTSYSAFAETSLRLANGLLAAGVIAGDRIAIMSGNRPEFIETYVAAARIGAVQVPVNTALRGRFLVHTLVDSGSAHLVVEAELLGAVADVLDELPDLRTLIVLDADAASAAARPVLDFTAVRAGGTTDPISTVVPVGDLAVIGYTSGTTGPAKGAMLSHRASWYAGDDARRHRDLGPDDVFSTTLPLFHLNAQHLTTIAVLEAGATLALERRFSASSFWGELRRSGATHTNVIGAMLGILVQRPPSDEERSETPRVVFGGPLSPAVLDAGRDRWNFRFVTGYGATECGIVTYAGTDELPVGSFGKPVPEFEVELVDDDGEPVAAGTPGEIVTRPRRPDSMMSGYWGNPLKTVEAFQNLWFHTGDMAKRDDDGFMYFVDRKKDALRRRGENISSTELEFALREYAGVAEVAVLAVPSALGEDDVKAALRLTEGASFDHREFLTWAGQKVPKFMVPRYVEVVDEFPRTATQRIEKYKLRERPLTASTWDSEVGGFVTEETPAR